MIKRFTNLQGINLYVNPIEQNDEETVQFIRAVNVDSFPLGAKTKRPGYGTHLGTADGSPVTTLFNWTRNDGSTFFNYRASGSSLYYSAQGTGAWTLCGNGTIAAGAHVDYAVLGDTLVVCDGAGSTRHSTDGTSFTNTTLAPVATSLEMYQNRIYAAGTASTLFYSTTGDATNWNTTGTSDSSSLTIPGAGKLSKIFKANDRLMVPKNSGLLFRWDGYSLVDTSSTLGPTSPYSVGQTEGYYFWINRLGHYGYAGLKPQLLSNAIQRQFYNNAGSGVAGGTFDVAPATVHRYDYLLPVGTITDDFTGVTLPNAIIKYDFQKNEYLNWQFNNLPTALLSYKDSSLNQKLIFGASNGQCYAVSGTATDDNGATITSVLEFVTDLGIPEWDKYCRYFYAYFNPGCQAKIAIALEETFVRERIKYIDVGDTSTGFINYKFPPGSRGKLLYVKIYEASRSTPFTFYGCMVDFDPQPQK